MADVRVIVVSPEEAQSCVTEFWCGAELMAFTILSDGQLQLHIEPRADGRPWVIDTTSLATSLARATGTFTTPVTTRVPIRS